MVIVASYKDSNHGGRSRHGFGTSANESAIALAHETLSIHQEDIPQRRNIKVSCSPFT